MGVRKFHGFSEYSSYAWDDRGWNMFRCPRVLLNLTTQKDYERSGHCPPDGEGAAAPMPRFGHADDPHVVRAGRRA